ncbi:MAG TPA: prepilin-type N-terminal cleavage/methylation domain-containing protein [Candidatus Paceibacterota bacterium]
MLLSLIKNKKWDKGFTLIELMVASSLFLVVMLIMSGSILSVFGANQRSKNLRSVMDNMNLTLESMTRTIRFGTNYHCGSAGNLSDPNNCAGGANSITVRSSDGVQTTYTIAGGRIIRRIGGVDYFMTSPEVVIDRLNFTVGGAPFGDLYQPNVLINISGHVEAKASDRANFILQTTVSQRRFDF